MNVDTINLVLEYYKAIWQYFDVEMLKHIFSNDITTFHKKRGECSICTMGIENVINAYRENFFSTLDLNRTRIYDFHIQPLPNKKTAEQIIVSYTLEQTCKTFGRVVETFEITDKLIHHITIDSTFLDCHKELNSAMYN